MQTYFSKGCTANLLESTKKLAKGEKPNNQGCIEMQGQGMLVEKCSPIYPSTLLHYMEKMSQHFGLWAEM